MMPSATAATMVYVVDDDTDVLGSLRFLLETDGFDVRTFRSAAALLNASASHRRRLLCDRLQDADHERHRPRQPVCATAMPAPRSSSSPAIPTGAFTDKAAAAGIHHVLLKPHLEESLVSRIRGAIQESPATGT